MIARVVSFIGVCVYSPKDRRRGPTTNAGLVTPFQSSTATLTQIPSDKVGPHRTWLHVTKSPHKTDVGPSKVTVMTTASWFVMRSTLAGGVFAWVRLV